MSAVPVTVPESENKTGSPGSPWLGWTVRERTLYAKGSEPGKYNEVKLEALRDRLKLLEERQEPADIIAPLAELHVEFLNSKMQAHFTTTSGRNSKDFFVSETGAQQMAREVLPTRFFTGLKELASIDGKGSEIATAAWNKFGSLQRSNRKVRLVNMNLGDFGVRRVIRSCHSASYAPYSNLEFVQDLLDHAGELADLPIVSAIVTDSILRLRFAVLDQSDRLALLVGQDPLAYRPVQMIEAWNSEVGLRKVILRAGLWRPICTNSVCHWSDKHEYSWIHRGKSARIKTGVSDAFVNLTTSANEVVTAYLKAKSVEIGDVGDWLAKKLGENGVSERVIGAAKLAVTDPSTTEGTTLATGIDAITFAARSEELIAQDDLERLAAQLLHAGMKEAE